MYFEASPTNYTLHESIIAALFRYCQHTFPRESSWKTPMAVPSSRICIYSRYQFISTDLYHLILSEVHLSEELPQRSGCTDARVQVQILSQMKSVVAKACKSSYIHGYIHHYMPVHQEEELLFSAARDTLQTGNQS